MTGQTNKADPAVKNLKGTLLPVHTVLVYTPEHYGNLLPVDHDEPWWTGKICKALFTLS